MKYYPIAKNWRKIKPHIVNADVQCVLRQDFNKYTITRFKLKFKQGMVPFEFESCDWYCNRKGRRPAYWNYVKHGACHWLVNFNLKLAMLVEPERDWRIITSDDHSSVWDGKNTLFDFNFSALGVHPDECFLIANKKQLKLGQLMEV